MMVNSATARDTGPWGGGDNPVAKKVDVTYENYRFCDGETLPALKIHYATLGKPHRGSDGSVDNAIEAGSRAAAMAG
jgi:homoserine O-acetyltransferase/O-succinyltransferase